MTVRVVAADRLEITLLSRWRSMQRQDPLTEGPFFCPEFVLAASEVWSGVQVGVVEAADGPAAILAFRRTLGGVGRPCAPGLVDFQGVVGDLAPTVEPTTFVRGCRLAALEFDHLLVRAEPFARFRTRVAPSPFIDVASGFEAYKAQRRADGSEQVKKLEALERKVARELGPLRVDPDSSDGSILEWLVERRTRQCVALGYANPLATRPVRRFVARLAAARTANFAPEVSALWAGETLLAAHLGLRSHGVLHYWLPTYADEHSRYSPGLLLLLGLVRGAPARGLRRIDLGRGDAMYKSRMMSGNVDVCDARIVDPRAGGFRRALLSMRDTLRTSRLAAPLRRLYRRMAGR